MEDIISMNRAPLTKKIKIKQSKHNTFAIKKIEEKGIYDDTFTNV